MSEDAALTSFAGEFETVLDVHTDEMIRAAIRTVRRSRRSKRVRAYSETRGIDTAHEIAVVVQRLVRADVSGVLFTADPVTGSRTTMTGNYIHGLGEDLVSGEAHPHTFTLKRPKGQYEGPPELKRFARKFYKLASRLEKNLGSPQDIEWAIVEGIVGRIPQGITIPPVHISRFSFLLALLPAIVVRLRKARQVRKEMPGYIGSSPDRCRSIRQQIQQAGTKAALILTLPAKGSRNVIRAK